MTDYNLQDTVALLERTPAALDALLRELPVTCVHANEGEGTWTVVDVLGHLLHGEHTDWMPRVQHILKLGDTQPFQPFDRTAMLRDSENQSLTHLLDSFSQARAASLIQLQALQLTPEDLDRHGLHPRLGPVTLSQLLATWATHDLTHLHQISRIMASQYRHAVGPWSAFLGVLHCEGHSIS